MGERLSSGFGEPSEKNEERRRTGLLEGDANIVKDLSALVCREQHRLEEIAKADVGSVLT